MQTEATAIPRLFTTLNLNLALQGFVEKGPGETETPPKDQQILYKSTPALLPRVKGHKSKISEGNLWFFLAFPFHWNVASFSLPPPISLSLSSLCLSILSSRWSSARPHVAYITNSKDRHRARNVLQQRAARGELVRVALSASLCLLVRCSMSGVRPTDIIGKTRSGALIS